MNSKIQVVSLTEHEFWRREFQAEVSTKDENYLARLRDLICSGVKPVIQVGPSRQEANPNRPALAEARVTGARHSARRHFLQNSCIIVVAKSI